MEQKYNIGFKTELMFHFHRLMSYPEDPLVIKRFEELCRKSLNTDFVDAPEEFTKKFKELCKEFLENKEVNVERVKEILHIMGDWKLK